MRPDRRRLSRHQWQASFLILFAIVLLSSPPTEAQIVAPAGRTLFNRGVLVRITLRYDAFDEVRPGDELQAWRNVYALVWGAHPRWSLSFVTPVLWTETTSSTETAADGTRSGTGDSTFFARYDLRRNNVRHGTTGLSTEFGIKPPTGGAFGTGSTDLLAGLIFSHIRDPNWLVTDAQYTRTDKGTNGLRLGNRWRIDLAYLRRVLPRHKPGVPMALAVVELNLEAAESSRRHGSVLPNTGGKVLFLTPGFEYLMSRRTVLELAAPIRIYEDLRGDQPRPEVGLIAGLRWLF